MKNISKIYLFLNLQCSLFYTLKMREERFYLFNLLATILNQNFHWYTQWYVHKLSQQYNRLLVSTQIIVYCIHTCVACDKKLEVPAGPVCMPAAVNVSATPRGGRPAFSPTTYVYVQWSSSISCIPVHNRVTVTYTTLHGQLQNGGYWQMILDWMLFYWMVVQDQQSPWTILVEC